MFDENIKCYKYKGIFVIVMLIVLVLFSVYLIVLTRNAWENYNYIGQSPEFTDRVTITGTGEATATPDIAEISIGVLTEKNTVDNAQTENTEKMNKIVKFLKDDFKIDEKDIKTSQYNINPRYDWSADSRRIIGYSVNQMVVVKVRDFDKIGDILSKAGNSGANEISGPNFIVDDPEVYREEAREEAITQAKEKAKVLAKQVGFDLGPIVGFNESQGSMPMPYYADMVKSEAGIDFGGGAPVIEAGSQEVSVSVNITYEIR